MLTSYEEYIWAGTIAVIGIFSIPWFLWGNATVVAGLPLWLWWHVGWMALTAAVFRLFARRAWGAVGGEYA